MKTKADFLHGRVEPDVYFGQFVTPELERQADDCIKRLNGICEARRFQLEKKLCVLDVARWLPASSKVLMRRAGEQTTARACKSLAYVAVELAIKKARAS